jgi:hypothetical protein
MGPTFGHCFHLLGHSDEVIEANKPLARPFVVTALALQIIETMAFDGGSNDRQHGRLNTNLFDANVVGIKNDVIKPLNVQPLADRARFDRHYSRR